jgi:hypothetical protein
VVNGKKRDRRVIETCGALWLPEILLPAARRPPVNQGPEIALRLRRAGRHDAGQAGLN